MSAKLVETRETEYGKHRIRVTAEWVKSAGPMPRLVGRVLVFEIENGGEAIFVHGGETGKNDLEGVLDEFELFARRHVDALGV